MYSVSLFLIKSLLVSGILTTWYWFALRNKGFHNYNRFFLLFTLYASIQLPLLHLDLFTIHRTATITTPTAAFLLHVVNADNVSVPDVASQAATSSIEPGMIALYAGAVVSLLLLSILCFKVLWVIGMSRKYTRRRMGEVTFVDTDLDKAPFSFLNFLFWKDSISLESENGRLIFEHELTHIQQKHTYDKLACQALTCIFWINPFYWLIQKELTMIHEFIADEQAIGGNDTEAFANMLLQTHNGGSYLTPGHQFFSSPIKRRLTMLQTNKKISHSLLRRIVLLPLATGIILAFSVSTARERKAINATKADKKIVLVVDPGHGGNDRGCSSGSLVEKDLTLRISTHLKELAPNYNVEVVLTRSGDDYPTLTQRVALCNKLHPDDFISIHVNDEAGMDKGTGSFDIAVNSKNPHYEKSGALATAIYRYVNHPEWTHKNAASDKSLMVLRENTVPAVLIELGDIKNKEQMAILTDNTKLDELCNSILLGVVAAHNG